MRIFVVSVFLLIGVWKTLPQNAAQRAALGRIEVMSFVQETGAPIPDVLITLTTLGAPARSVVTERDGRFVFNDLQPGEYSVRAQLEGYFSAADTGSGSPATIANAKAVVTAGQTSEVRFPMILAGAISGRVQTSNGRPAAGSQVQAFRLGYYPDGAPLLAEVRTRGTDDRGEFRLYQLPPGTYYLSVTTNGPGGARGTAVPGAARPEVPVRTLYPSAIDISEARPLTLASGEEIEGANIDLRNAAFAKVSGRVFSVLPVSVYDPPPSTSSEARGAESGAAGADNAAVQAALAALEQLRAQRGETGPTGAASATPLPTAQLQMVPRDRLTLQDPGINRSGNAALAAPNDGNFNFENVPPGSYVLYASLPDNTGAGAGQQPGSGTNPRAFGRVAFDVGTSDVAGIAVTVHHGIDVTGRVFTDADPSVFNGMRISLQPDDSAGRVNLYQQIGRHEAEVREDGAFTIPILPEAVYRVQVKFGGGPMAKRAFVWAARQDGADILEGGFAVDDSIVAPVEIFVSIKSGSVAGMAQDAEGRPVPNAVVALIPPPERRHNPVLYRTVSADAGGKFTLTGVPPGDFKLFAWRSLPSGAHRNAAFMARYENSGMPVTVEANGEVRADPMLATASSQ